MCRIQILLDCVNTVHRPNYEGVTSIKMLRKRDARTGGSFTETLLRRQ